MTKKVIAYAWVGGVVALALATIVRQARILFPLARSGQDVSNSYILHLQKSLLLRPVYLLPWAVLVTSGMAITWPNREDWRSRSGRLYVFLGCSFSIFWFFCILVFVR
jgi:hypothetical protein